MTVEVSFIPGVFNRYEICLEYGIVTRPPRWAERWSIFLKYDGAIIRFSPGNALRVRYGGYVYETLRDDQLAMLKHKLETDFAVEQLE